MGIIHLIRRNSPIGLISLPMKVPPSGHDGAGSRHRETVVAGYSRSGGSGQSGYRAMSEKCNHRIAQLDGWRGVSILFVVVGHLNVRYNAHPETVVDYNSLAFHLSTLGFNIFFVISGFIITKLALREFDQTGRFSIRNFYTRRFFRIIPPLFLYLGAVMLAAAFLLIEQAHSETLAAAAFVCNIPGVSCGWFGGHTWTLAYEEQFYISFPLLFALVGVNMRKFIAILFIVLVALPFLRAVLHLGDGWRAFATFATVFSYICVGAVIAAYEVNIKRLAESRYAAYFSCGAAFLLIGLLFLKATFAFPPGSPLAYMLVALNNTIPPICIAWLVGSSVHQSNLFTRALAMPPLVFIGMISYSLYLWQQFFMAPRWLYISDPDSLLLIPPLMFVVATLSYYLVERPSVQLGKRLVDWQDGLIEKKSHHRHSPDGLIPKRIIVRGPGD
jgi:peptidoglycan/LPS O-acetylase OafA/YrhL